MPRWSSSEQHQIDEIRKRLKESGLLDRPAFPEVVGDRKIVRFLRGHNHDIDKAYEMMSKFLIWRKDNNVDQIRRDIIDGGMDHPTKFPEGEKILGLIPQLVISADACDKFGSPICVDQYNFSPSHVLANISLDKYIHFVIYTLEYRSLIVEQLSEEKEQKFIQSVNNDPELLAKAEPYGVLVHTCVIRDLNGVGFEHIGARGQEIIRSVIGVSSDNYPELMRKCFMINMPWLFNTIWFFIKGLLAARTVAKVNISGGGYMSELEKDIDKDKIPAMIGGAFKENNKGFVFDKNFFNTNV